MELSPGKAYSYRLAFLRVAATPETGVGVCQE
jgi:hypothetical protein